MIKIFNIEPITNSFRESVTRPGTDKSEEPDKPRTYVYERHQWESKHFCQLYGSKHSVGNLDIGGASNISRASTSLSTAQEQFKPVRHFVCTRKSARIEIDFDRDTNGPIGDQSTLWISTSASSAAQAPTSTCYHDRSPRGYRCLGTVVVFWVKVLGVKTIVWCIGISELTLTLVHACHVEVPYLPEAGYNIYIYTRHVWWRNCHSCQYLTNLLFHTINW